MKDFQQITFTTEVEMKNFIDTQEQTDQWIGCYSKELEAVPLENNELNLYVKDAFQHTLLNGFSVDGFEKSVTEDEIKSSMETTKMSLALPVNNKFELYPLRYTAWDQIQARAGITGASINSVKEKANAYEMAPQDRCMILNKGLALRKDKALVLIRDGKITACLSGDEADYKVLKSSELIKITENKLRNYFTAVNWTGSTVSHEILSVTYKVNDAELEKRILNLLKSYGLTRDKIDVSVMLTTSDVGKCAARLTPIIKADGRSLPFGLAQSVTHKGETAEQKFSAIAETFMAKFRENIKNIEKLMQIKITNPASCLYNVYEELGLSGYASALKQCMERIKAEHATFCTAYDIYWYLNEMLYITEDANTKAGKITSLYGSIKAQETVAKVLFMDVTAFDY